MNLPWPAACRPVGDCIAAGFVFSEQVTVRLVLRIQIPTAGERYVERERTKGPLPRYVEGHLLRPEKNPVGVAEDGQGGAVAEAQGGVRKAPRGNRRSGGAAGAGVRI